MKILIIGCYSLDDGYLQLVNSLKEAESSLEFGFFPYYEYLDKLKDGSGNIDDIFQAVDGLLNRIDYCGYKPLYCRCDAVIVWHTLDQVKEILSVGGTINVEVNLGQIIKKIDRPIYGIDWSGHGDINRQWDIFDDVLKLFDYIWCSQPNLINKHTNVGHLKLGPKDSFISSSRPKVIDTDVIFIGYNLYDNYGNSKLKRRQVIDYLIGMPDIRIKIYGGPEFQTLYPDHYYGKCPYRHLTNVLSTSLTVLNLIPLEQDECQTDNQLYYYNDLLPIIYSAGSIPICNIDFGQFLKPIVDHTGDYIYATTPEAIANGIRTIKTMSKPLDHNPIRGSVDEIISKLGGTSPIPPFECNLRTSPGGTS